MLLGRIEDPGAFTKIHVRKTDGCALLRERNGRQEKRTNPHVFHSGRNARILRRERRMRLIPATVVCRMFGFTSTARATGGMKSSFRLEKTGVPQGFEATRSCGT